MKILIAESQNAVKWFFNKSIIVKLQKFKTNIILKGNQTVKPEQFLIGDNVIEVVSSVKLLGILVDDPTNFNLYKVIFFQAT